MTLLPKILHLRSDPEQRRIELYKSIMHLAGQRGGQLFGPIPKGHRREFFCLDEHTWVWHEEWIDEHKQRHAVTTRYDVHPSGVLKSQGGHHYQTLTLEESRNLYQAVSLFEQTMYQELPRLVAESL